MRDKRIDYDGEGYVESLMTENPYFFFLRYRTFICGHHREQGPKQTESYYTLRYNVNCRCIDLPEHFALSCAKNFFAPEFRWPLATWGPKSVSSLAYLRGLICFAQRHSRWILEQVSRPGLPDSAEFCYHLPVLSVHPFTCELDHPKEPGDTVKVVLLLYHGVYFFLSLNFFFFFLSHLHLICAPSLPYFPYLIAFFSTSNISFQSLLTDKTQQMVWFSQQLSNGKIEYSDSFTCERSWHAECSLTMHGMNIGIKFSDAWGQTES